MELASGRVTARVKTGYLVGGDRDVRTDRRWGEPRRRRRRAPWIYVSNATNDTVTVIDAAAGVAGEIELNVPGLERLRGVLPFGLALSPDESRLFVACAGLNAVAVVDTGRAPSRATCRQGGSLTGGRVEDGRTLFVSSAKGLGSGPNGGRGFVDPGRGPHPGDIMQGTLQIVPVPDPAALATTRAQSSRTRRAARGCLARSTRGRPDRRRARSGPIRHIVFVVKENRTFDQVFGQRRGVDGDPRSRRSAWG